MTDAPAPSSATTSLSIFDALHNRLEILHTPAIFWVHQTQTVFQPGLYVSLHRVGMPPVQANPLPVVWKCPDPWSYRYPRMVSKRDWWSALVPAKWAYEDLLLPLARIEAVQVTINGCVQYRLGSLRAWQYVEASLHSFEQCLNGLGAWTYLETEFTPYPSDYGYDGTFQTETELRKAMKKIRAVFVLHVARLTYLVFLLRRRKDDWLEDLVESGKIAPGFYRRILQSAIYQEAYQQAGSFERVGMIIDVTSLEEKKGVDELQAMIQRYSIPVWLYFGGSTRRAIHPWARQYMPSPSRILACVEAPAIWGISALMHEAPQRDGQRVQVDETSQVTTTPMAMAHYSTFGQRPDEVSRQYPGQTWQEFIAAEERMLSDIRSHETKAQRSIRLQREAEELAMPWPTQSSTCRIFVWEEEQDGVWTRTLATNMHGQDIWQSTTPSQRRYNSSSHEWDICPRLDPADEVRIDDGDKFECWGYSAQYAETEGQSQFVQTPCYPSRSPSPDWLMESALLEEHARHEQTHGFASPEARRQSAVPTASQSSCSPRSPPPSLPPRQFTPSPQKLVSVLPESPGVGDDMQIAGDSQLSCAKQPVLGLPLVSASWKRYGICTTSGEHKGPQSSESTHVDNLKVRKIMAHTNETIPTDLIVSATDFVCALSFHSKALDCLVNLPSHLSDMIPGHPRGYPRSWKDRKMMVKSNVDGDDQIWYVITSSTLPSEDEVSWTLAVQDPLTVNQILRENRGPSILHVCLSLLESGIPFKTIEAHPDPPTSLWPPPPMPLFYRDTPLALGIRLDRNYTLEDYESYADQRQAIVNSRRGRAAFLKGGIIWRLALECRPYVDVIMGPSRCHTRRDFIMLDGRGFVDDVLSEHELAVICGTYRVLPEKTRLEGRAASESWWPSDSIWKDCGHSVGYWTPNCEQWFQTRRDGILAGKEKPKGPTAWRDALKHMKARTKTMLKNARALATLSLSDAPKV